MMIDESTIDLCVTQRNLTALANRYFEAQGIEKDAIEVALVNAIDRIAASYTQDEPVSLLTILEPLLDGPGLSDALFIKLIEVLESKHYLNYLESLAEVGEDLTASSAEKLAEVLIGNYRFHTIGTLVDYLSEGPRERIGLLLAQALEEIVRVNSDDAVGFEELERVGDLIMGHTRPICSLLEHPASLAMSDSTLLRLLSAADQANIFFEGSRTFRKDYPDLYELAELYIRISTEQDRKLVEKLFVASVGGFLYQFEDISSDIGRARSLPYDDERKNTLLASPDLSEAMKRKCSQILGLMKMYSKYREGDLDPPKQPRDSTIIASRAGNPKVTL